MTELTWRELIPKLKRMKEDDVLALLQSEQNGARRTTVMLRLHQRFTALRARRERKEILKVAR